MPPKLIERDVNKVSGNEDNAISTDKTKHIKDYNEKKRKKNIVEAKNTLCIRKKCFLYLQPLVSACRTQRGPHYCQFTWAMYSSLING